MAECKTCGGTGKVFMMNSWFIADGYRRERCGICAGTGESSYRPCADVVRFRKRAEARIADWGGLKPGTAHPPHHGDE